MLVEHNYSDLKVAVIGAGNWGKNLIRVYHELGALRAICDHHPLKAATLSDKYEVANLTLEEILDSSEIDAVVIATPSTTHQGLGNLCLLANKHVFIEKPLCLQAKSAHSLYQLAQQQQRILMVGHLLQYHPAFIRLKQLKNDGHLGQLQTIHSHRSNFGKFPGEESVLWDFAPHDVSMILALVGQMPHSVSASGSHYLSHTSNDLSYIHLDFPAHEQGHIFVSWLHPYKEQKLIVVGDKAMAVFEDSQPWESKLKLYPYPPEWIDGLPRPFPSQGENVVLTPSEPLANECKHFLDCILHNKQPLTNGAEGSNVITVLEAAAQSISSQQPIQRRVLLDA